MVPPMSGHAAKELLRATQSKFLAAAFGTEVLYSVVIILCSLMVWFATRELYALSNHRGIKYFRRAFLFLAAAFFVRSFIKFLLVFVGRERIIDVSPYMVGQCTGFLYVYLSMMAAFYLVFSLVSKRVQSKHLLALFHGVSVLVGLVLVFSRDVSIILSLIGVILVFLVVAAFKVHKRRKGNRLHSVYALLFIFLALNIVDILVPSMLQAFQLFIYLASTVVFLLIMYRVLTRAGA